MVIQLTNVLLLLFLKKQKNNKPIFVDPINKKTLKEKKIIL